MKIHLIFNKNWKFFKLLIFPHMLKINHWCVPVLSFPVKSTLSLYIYTWHINSNAYFLYYMISTSCDFAGTSLFPFTGHEVAIDPYIFKASYPFKTLAYPYQCCIAALITFLSLTCLVAYQAVWFMLVKGALTHVTNKHTI